MIRRKVFGRRRLKRMELLGSGFEGSLRISNP